MNGALIILSAVLVFLLVASRPALSYSFHHVEEVSCEQVAAELNACRTYVEERAEEPCSRCCEAVEQVGKWHKRKKLKRHHLCKCLKKTFSGRSNDAGRVESLPRKCHVNNLDFPDIDDPDCD